MERVSARRFVVNRELFREIDMSGRATNDEPLEPATLFRVMQTAIAEELRQRYAPPQKMSHQLFVLMMQMNDRARRERAQAAQAEQTTRPERRPSSPKLVNAPDAASIA